MKSSTISLYVTDLFHVPLNSPKQSHDYTQVLWQNVCTPLYRLVPELHTWVTQHIKQYENMYKTTRKILGETRPRKGLERPRKAKPGKA